VVIKHIPCDHAAGGALRCEHCGEPVNTENIRVLPAPNAKGPDGKPATLTPPQLAAWGSRSAS
jgi:hypothetical protein